MIKYDRLIWQISAIILLVSLIFLLANHFTTQFPVVDFPSALTTHAGIFVCFLVYILGFYLEKMHTQSALLCKTIGMITLTAFIMLIADSGFFTTPFALKDNYVMKIDQFLHFYLPHLVAWIQHYPAWAIFFNQIYRSLFLMLFILPITLALLNDKMAVYRFFLACLTSCFIGYFIYYFFPTSGPAAVLHSPYFPVDAAHIVSQFHHNHHYFSENFYRAGFISAPSFHTIWAVLFVCSVAGYKKYLFPLMFIYSSLVIFSTLTTGWHFVADDISGLFVALFSWFFALKLTQH